MCKEYGSTTLWFDCECHLPDHAIRLSVHNDGQACLDVRPVKASLFTRIKNAIKYVLFSKRDYPVYCEIILNAQACQAMSKALATVEDKTSDTQE